jgi:Iron-containing redox enzyme
MSQEGPELPPARGELSTAIISHLTGHPTARHPSPTHTDPFGDDLQLALYLCYELHYHGFRHVSEDLEWDPHLLTQRAAMEQHFLAALQHHPANPRPTKQTEARAELDRALDQSADDGPLSRFLRDHGRLWHLREYAILRSLYQLKEADPHAWVLPRLQGRAKAAMVAIEYDEFGAGHPEHIHARLYADLMADLGLNPTYGSYLPTAPAPALATVNLMSLLGLHRSLRGALIGHFAATEIASPPAARNLAHAMKRTRAGSAAEYFYTEHTEADAVHEQVVRHEIINGLLHDQPHLTSHVTFGIQATQLTENHLAHHLLATWNTHHTALRTPT